VLSTATDLADSFPRAVRRHCRGLALWALSAGNMRAGFLSVRLAGVGLQVRPSALIFQTI
jgi:hypothetical protein